MVIKTANGPAARGRLVAASVLIILALIFVSGWIMRRGPVAVRTEKVISEDIASVISTNGKIEPVANFEAHAPASTTVKRVLVKESNRYFTYLSLHYNLVRATTSEPASFCCNSTLPMPAPRPPKHKRS